jgi:hypothetical protein
MNVFSILPVHISVAFDPSLTGTAAGGAWSFEGS